MNEKIKTNSIPNEEQSITDRVCALLDEIGWLYDREEDKIQVIFKSDSTKGNSIVICVADIMADKIFISTAVGIKANKKNEMLQFLNFLNLHKLFFGRFVLSDDMTVWYDYTADIKACEITKNQCYRAFCIADNCCECYIDDIINVAVCGKTAEEAIKEIK